MLYLKTQGYGEFAKSPATIEFTRYVNDVFDVMNTSGTSKLNEKVFKNPISPANEHQIFSYFDKAFDYFKTLKLQNGKVIVTSRSRCAFKGLMTNMVNFRFMYEECVKTNLMPNFHTQSFSQDHSESFFGQWEVATGILLLSSFVQLLGNLSSTIAIVVIIYHWIF